MEAEPPDDWSPALVVIDVQNKFYHVTDGLKASFDRCSDQLNRTIGMFRGAGRPVVFVCYEGNVQDCTADVRNGDDIISSVDYRQCDRVVRKRSMNSFHESELSDTLAGMGCDSIVLSGMVAHLCVLSTYFSAYDHGFTSYIAKGTIAATDQDNVIHTEAISATLDEVTLRRKLCPSRTAEQFDYKCRL